jgi:hypothetical protein
LRLCEVAVRALNLARESNGKVAGGRWSRVQDRAGKRNCRLCALTRLRRGCEHVVRHAPPADSVLLATSMTTSPVSGAISSMDR